MSVITAGRGPDGISAELLVTAYSSRLKAYPADVVRWALLTKTWKWFPTWDELDAVCKAKASPRRQMIAALSKPFSEQEPEFVAPTDEEKKRMADLIAEKFPGASKQWQDAALREMEKPDYLKR